MDPITSSFLLTTLLQVALPAGVDGHSQFRVVPRPLAYEFAGNGLSALTLDGGDTELEFGDTNGDGHLDLVMIGDHGSPFVNTNQHGITTFFGDGRGNWTLGQVGNFGYGGLALGDVNRDGFLDVAYGMHHNYASGDFGDQLLEVALGDGSGLAWTPWDDGLATNGETWGMFATDLADVDGDGLLDVLSNSFGCCAGAHVYRNNGDGTWTQTFGFLGGNADALALFADFDGDGHADFVVGNSMGRVWRGDGSGGFTNLDGDLPPSFNGFDAADLDFDGRAELVFVRGNRIEIRSYMGAGTWVQRSTAGLPESGPFRGVQIADADADGLRDLFVHANGGIVVYRGDGGQRWRPGASLSTPIGALQALRVDGDFDHNGRPDIAFVQDENCGLFCSRNKLYVVREASVPERLDVHLAEPRGGAVWRAGTVQRVTWYAGVPGGSPTVDVELSTTGPAGPFTPLGSGLAEDGSHEIIVPTSPTTNAFLRVTVRVGSARARSMNAFPFTILP